VSLLVRTWNVFHGNTVPPGRRGHLRAMLDLALADDPDVLCLQELPAWALRLLVPWSGREVASARARPSVFVALPIPAGLGRALTATHHGLFRSAFAGQGIATLVAPRFELREHHELPLNPTSFRADQVRALELDARAAREWGSERRVAQAAVLTGGDRELVVVNLHATSSNDRRLAAAELQRAAAWARELAGERPLVLAGDFNLEHERSPALADLVADGFSPAGPGIDHVLARGLAVERAEQPWPEERRRKGGLLLSDHAPVESVLAW
jgi:endonuclease/exonuclease/phosphatase family metal-dependent hydrolase